MKLKTIPNIGWFIYTIKCSGWDWETLEFISSDCKLKATFRCSTVQYSTVMIIELQELYRSGNDNESIIPSFKRYQYCKILMQIFTLFLYRTLLSVGVFQKISISSLQCYASQFCLSSILNIYNTVKEGSMSCLCLLFIEVLYKETCLII